MSGDRRAGSYCAKSMRARSVQEVAVKGDGMSAGRAQGSSCVGGARMPGQAVVRRVR